MLTIIEDLGLFPYGNQDRKNRQFLVECECGKRYQMSRDRFNITERCRTCNNKYHNNSITHGETNEPLFKKWNAMIHRCYGNGDVAYTKGWKDKGVTVCDAWRHDYLAFKEWALANGYQQELHIDKDIICARENIEPRIYSPETCLFVTGSENTAQRNRDQGGQQ